MQNGSGPREPPGTQTRPGEASADGTPARLAPHHPHLRTRCRTSFLLPQGELPTRLQNS